MNHFTSHEISSRTANLFYEPADPITTSRRKRACLTFNTFLDFVAKRSSGTVLEITRIVRDDFEKNEMIYFEMMASCVSFVSRQDYSFTQSSVQNTLIFPFSNDFLVYTVDLEDLHASDSNRICDVFRFIAEEVLGWCKLTCHTNNFLVENVDFCDCLTIFTMCSIAFI